MKQRSLVVFVLPACYVGQHTHVVLRGDEKKQSRGGAAGIGIDYGR